MLAICLGNALCVWDDLKAAEELLKGFSYKVFAANDVGARYEGHLDAWVSLHPDKFPAWQAEREGNDDYRAFGFPMKDMPQGVEPVAERWRASSGIFQAQVAIEKFDCAGVILCGVPLSNDAGHLENAEWAEAERFHRGALRAKTEVGGRIRSLSGWTAETFGKPDEKWIRKVADVIPGRPARPNRRRARAALPRRDAEGSA